MYMLHVHAAVQEGVQPEEGDAKGQADGGAGAGCIPGAQACPPPYQIELAVRAVDDTCFLFRCTRLMLQSTCRGAGTCRGGRAAPAATLTGAVPLPDSRCDCLTKADRHICNLMLMS